jgi:hypothetical protein
MHTRLVYLSMVSMASALVGPHGLDGQGVPSERLGFETRAGVSVPTGALSRGQRGLVTRIGISKGVAGLLRVHPSVSIFGGWSRHGFDCDETSACSPDSEISSSGPEVGARIVLPHRTKAVPWLRAGVTFHRFRYVLDGIEAVSDRSAGVDFGGGVDFSLGRFFTFTPGLRFGYYESDLDMATFNTGAEPFTSAFLVLDLGGRVHF